jgi:glycosyltransferase involved in cell wall biosynthesis
MKLVFATVQGLQGSTNIGRVLPLAEEFKKKGYECHILGLRSGAKTDHFHVVGNEPFRRTENGKQRLGGLALILNMLETAIRTAWSLHRLEPDVVVISKPLPANTLGVWLYTIAKKLQATSYKLVLDADDFELTANKLSSIAQRAVIHWSERHAAHLADTIVVASPFLADHFKQLTQNSKPVEVIATGIGLAGGAAGAPHPLEQLHHRVGAQQRQDPQAILIYLGSISVSSGHRVDLLPDMLQKIQMKQPGTRLLIAGDGDDVALLKKEFAARGLAEHVAWHGRFTSSEVAGLLSTESIIIDPVDGSIANRAKSSYRVMLAAAMGLPVVTSNIGIRPELLPAQFHDRFFADPANTKSYAEKVAGLINQPLSAEEQTIWRQHALAYTWPRLADRYYEILKP